MGIRVLVLCITFLSFGYISQVQAVDIDMSDATMEVLSPTEMKLRHVKVLDNVYWGDFQWDPLANNFRVIDAGLENDGFNEITSISISPINPTISQGTTLQFSALANFSNGTEADVTDLVTWLSADDSLVFISNDPAVKGLALGRKNGSVRITAFDPSTGVLNGTTIKNQDTYYLDLRKASINNDGTAITVPSGASVSVSLEYTIWSRVGCPGCIDYIALGIEGDGQDTHSTGIPGSFPGRSGSANFALVAPTKTGSYTIYGLLSPDVSAGNAIKRYENNFPDSTTPGFIPIGTVHVTKN